MAEGHEENPSGRCVRTAGGLDGVVVVERNSMDGRALMLMELGKAERNQ